MKRLFLDLGEYGHLTGAGVPIQQWHDHGQGLIRTILHAAGVETDLASRRLCSNLQHLAPQLRGYDMLLMNVRSYTFPGAAEAARVFKRFNPEGVVLVGGMHAMVDLPGMEAVEEFDHIVQGGGESIIVDLVKDHGAYPRVIQGKQARSLADWPMIDRKLWPRERLPQGSAAGTWPLEASCGWGPPPVATMITSRVCPWKCSLTAEARIPVEGLGLVAIGDLQRTAGAALQLVVGGGSVSVRPLVAHVRADSGSRLATRWIDEGEAETFTITLRNGFSITATAGHRFRVIRNAEYVWSEVKDLKPGDWLPVQHSTEAWGDYQTISASCTPRKTPQSLSLRLDEELAWLVGLFVGDGAFHHHSRCVDWCVLPDIQEKVLGITRKYFGKSLKARIPKQSDKVRIIQLSGRIAYTWFADGLGLGPNKLTVPEAIFRGPRSVAEAFIEGLFEADGYAPPKGGRYISTISPELAHGVGLLLLNMGKHPSILKVKQPKRCLSRRSHHYRISLDQRRDRVPIGQSAYFNKYKGERYVGLRANLKTPGCSGVSREVLAEIDPGHDLLQRKQRFSQVASIEPAGVQRVYDISVPDGETFIANGFVSHNSFCNEFSYIPNMDRRPVDLVIEELNLLDEQYGLGSVVIHDSMFFQNPTYLKEWLEKYPRKARRVWPYWAAARADTVRKWPDLFEALVRETNWTSVSIGFESGSDRVLKLINKECTAEDNLFTIDLLNRIGEDLVAQGRERPRFWANIMYGIPGETPEDVFATKRMIRRMIDPMITPATYAPFPGSMLGYQITAEGKSYLGESHFRFLGGKYMAGIDYDFLRDVEAGAYDFEIDEAEWLPGANPQPIGDEKRKPSRFYLFPLRSGKKRIAYGESPEQAREIMSWRMSVEEMAQIAEGPIIEVRQQDIHPHLKELG